MIDHIKEYTERGWVIHPLTSPQDAGNSPGKRPLLKGWQLLKKTPELKAFPPGCNIGLVCGKVSGVMVIDYDNQMFIEGSELPPDKSGWLPPTIPKDLVAQHMSEQERNVVGSALKGPVYQGQPVNHKNNVDTDKGFAMQGGTIHPPDKSSGILYPSTPRSKDNLVDVDFLTFPPETLESRRTSGRGHIFYRYDPKIKSQKHNLLGIEILSDGSNAVLPPSVHRTGEIYKWVDDTAQVIEIPDIVKERLLNLFNIESELMHRVSKCRSCFKKVLKDYPANIPDVHGADGRLFMLAICTDLVALGAKERHLKMFSKLVYREKYNDQRTTKELKGVAPGKTWRCETIREKLPACVNCSECVSYKFSSPGNEQTERMKVTIPATVTELTLVIEK